ncbi:hypothetical protein AGMMS49953_01800 [Endomicrobiia bacterium]|nr:hypothetical protein AGMMS49953_01800 [Endomicrobiia bacterium]
MVNNAFILSKSEINPIENSSGLKACGNGKSKWTCKNAYKVFSLSLLYKNYNCYDKTGSYKGSLELIPLFS